MEDRGVRPAADDRGIAPARSAPLQVDLLEGRFHLVLEALGLRRAHGRAVRVCRDVGAALQRRALVGGLHLPQIPDHVRGVDDREPRHALSHPLGEVERLRQLVLHARTPAEDEREPRLLAFEGVEEGVVLARVLRPALAQGLAVHQAGQEPVELRSEAHLVDAGRLLRFLLCQQVPLPVLATRVGGAHEQDALLRLVAGQQHERRVFLVDARQVQHVAVLPVLVVDVAREDARGRAPVDEDTLGAERLHHPRAPGPQVVLQLARARHRRHRHGQQQTSPRSSHRLTPRKVRVFSVLAPSEGNRQRLPAGSFGCRQGAADLAWGRTVAFLKKQLGA